MSQRLRSQRVAQTFTQGRHSMRALEGAPARRKCCTTQTRTVLAASQDGTGHSRLTPRPGRLRAFLAGAWLLAASRPGSLVAHRLGPGSCSAALGKRGDLRGRGHAPTGGHAVGAASGGLDRSWCSGSSRARCAFGLPCADAEPIAQAPSEELRRRRGLTALLALPWCRRRHRAGPQR